MVVKDFMTKKVSIMSPDDTVYDAATRMKDQDTGAVFVTENDKLIGVITDRDIVVRVITKSAEFGSTKVREAMTPKVLYCYEEDSIEDVAQNLANNQVRRMPVINQDKRLVGVVSLGDICLNDKNCAAVAMEKICKRS